MLIKLNILAYTVADSTKRDLEAAVAGVEGMGLQARPLKSGTLSTAIDAATQADVLVIESAGADVEVMKEVEEFVTGLPEDVVVFVIGDAANPTLLRRLMRVGVRDVLASPVVRQDVVNVLTTVLSEKRARAMARGENVTSSCAFINAKGGSGGTLLAVNVACALAARHKAKVALIDFDMQFGDCALLLDTTPQNNVGDALRQADRIDAVLLKTMMTEHSSGVHLLASPATPSAAAELDAHAVRRVLDAAAAAYDIVIIDLPRVSAPWTLEAMRSATTTFLVLQNNLSTLRDARLLVDHLPRTGIDARRIEIINNRAMAKTPSVTIEQLKETLKHEKVHRVRNDFETAVAAEDQGIPVHKVDARSDLAKDIDHLADYIWAAHGHGEAKKEGFLDKFFRPKGDAPGKAH